MEPSPELMPPEYYDMNKSAFVKRALKRMRKRKKKSLHLKRAKTQQKSTKKEYICIILTNVVSLAFLIAIGSIVLSRSLSTQVNISCPVGFYGEECERDDFVDSMKWSSDELISTAQGVCNSGYSFRTWAPGALSVRLHVRNPDNSQSLYYPMSAQKYGFWFVKICNLDFSTQYTFHISYRTESRYSLSLGGLERTPFSSMEANLIVDEEYHWNSMFVGLPSKPVFYQINVPTYYEEDYDTPLDTVIQRLQTIQLTGANVLELHGVEQSSCDQQYDICWIPSSYSPGMLRPTIGNNLKLKELIDKAHQMNISVVLDLDWESFSTNSVIYNYHQFYRLYRLQPDDILGSTDVFRNPEICGSRCALNIVDNRFILLFLRSVLHEYRTEFHIDGIRWITNHCDSFIGGVCDDVGQSSNANSVAINDLWTDIRSEGFAIITDDQSSVPDYDVLINESLCPFIRSITSSTGLTRSVLLSIVYLASESSTNTALSLECYRSLTSRLFPRTNYNTAAIVLSLFYLLPTPLHFFMGTPFLSDIPFDEYPEVLDINEVGTFIDGSWQNPRSKYMKMRLSVDMNVIRQLYLSDTSEGISIEHDSSDNSVMMVRVGTSTSPLLALINYSNTNYVTTPYTFTIQSQQPFNTPGSWTMLFSTANSRYDSEAQTVNSVLSVTDCQQDGLCYSATLPPLSLVVFSRIL